ncbi:MAG: hypothetical protein KF832_09815 [Caldilineaceae bacterium]|nr:hypothetical protein [Caldilineaceae bacterium]
MHRTVEAIIDPSGFVRILQPVSILTTRRALVTILDEPVAEISATALLSQTALTEDWLRPEEDEAWSYLQQATSSYVIQLFA